MSAVYPRTFNKRYSFWLLVRLWMHFITPSSLNLNRKENHVSWTSHQVEHLTRSHHPTPPNPDHQKKNFQRDKRDHRQQDPTRKWCNYHSSAWQDTSECKARKTFLEKLSTSDLFDRTLVESDPDASALLASTSTTPTASTIVDEEEQERLFHTWIWVQNNPLHLIVDNGSQKNFVSEDLVNKLGLVTTPHPEPSNISWMKDGKELRITRQCRLAYFIKPFEEEVPVLRGTAFRSWRLIRKTLPMG